MCSEVWLEQSRLITFRIMRCLFMVFTKKVNKRRKRAGIFIFSNLLTFLLGSFGILTKLQSMAGLEKYETLREDFFFLPIIL